ncbi:interleukin 17 receptor A1a [Notolabrus celidotus]|uniref:interleukin 17 receptor A1a n=1 Tax=Notolabrus celidotus TaxID=1203425 RepID=UPI00148FFEDF|nr:interleukin 17 receptor A1a [Notolabrus celidotus]
MNPLLLRRSLFLLLCVSGSWSLRVSSWPPANCSRQGLPCSASHNNCMDSSWMDVNVYTPSAPEDLKVSVLESRDDEGQLQPLLLAEWKIKDDGSIHALKATELHVLVMSTNENSCVRFSVNKTLPMRSLSGEQWSFFADMLVLDPGETYIVSVFNIPKPELKHSSYSVSAELRVPGCEDPRMRMTQFCMERGSLWQPGLSVSQVRGGSGLTVSFRPHSLCDEYIIIALCSRTRRAKTAYKTNQKTLNVTFSLDEWPSSCCQFDAEIKPLFPSCGSDCARTKTTVNICPNKTVLSENTADAPLVPPYTFVSCGLVFMCVVAVAVGWVLCRKTGKADYAPAPAQKLLLPKQPPKVLVIYSQDHRLYRDVVLKLCAFLQAKCGTKVLVDLLDTTTVGMVGRMCWLEWQRQQLKNPSDKILVLCSRGVQAKWRAVCGQGRVVLREDVLSPNDDMLTPFLNLSLPDMHQAGMLGKYMVAYFDDISGEEDVPSVFDIAVKYKLMKHFEELFFRILDVEKYQPGQVRHIEGISGDEYFNCPSGRALKDAIETFQAFQLGSPDWFEKECLNGEEDVTDESKQLIAHMQIPPVLECVPLIKRGPPVHVHDVETQQGVHSVHVITPELNPERQLASVVEIAPVLNQETNQSPSSLAEVLTDHLSPHSPRHKPVLLAEPVFNMPPRPDWASLQGEPSAQTPTEDDEEDSLPPMSSHPDHEDQILQSSWDSDLPESSHASRQSCHAAPTEDSLSQPVELDQVLDSSGKGQSSGSDQGYISKMSSQEEPAPVKDPLAALRRLQEEMLQDHLQYFEEPEEN